MIKNMIKTGTQRSSIKLITFLEWQSSTTFAMAINLLQAV